MSHSDLSPDGIGLEALIARVSDKAKKLFGHSEKPGIIVSPYRMNPLGAHIDHQGGSVLARTVNQYTVLAYYPLSSSRIVLHSDTDAASGNATAFDIGSTESDQNWVRYAKASVATVAAQHATLNGFSGLVSGTMVGAGLSSSASVILAYLSALAQVNSLHFSEAEMVELSRQVENEYMGLNNGVQDQMSVVFGRSDALSLLQMESVTADYIDNPGNAADVAWVICYSGFSRELISSGFNDRVRECREAASLLDASATRLGEVHHDLRTPVHIDKLPAELGRRAKHVYGEMERVARGCDAWRNGEWEEFGRLMNASCHSSINNYECGSQPMIDLHKIALDQQGVYGSRFGGGGYGGCLAMLSRRDKAHEIGQAVIDKFLQLYPEKNGIARMFVARNESCVRAVPA